MTHECLVRSQPIDGEISVVRCGTGDLLYAAQVENPWMAEDASSILAIQQAATVQEG